MKTESDLLDLDTLQQDFTYIVLQKIDPAKNAKRFYYIAWQTTTLGWAVVRAYGRIGVRSRLLAPLPFASFADAWPLIRKTIHTRLRRGYQPVIDWSGDEPEYPLSMDMAHEPAELRH